MIYKFEFLWPNFEMMTSQDGATTSRFWKNSFINEYLALKFLLLWIFIFLSLLIYKIQNWPSFEQIITTLSQNFKILREPFHKQIIHLKLPFTFDFHLSINFGTRNNQFGPFRSIFGWWRPYGESKFQNF